MHPAEILKRNNANLIGNPQAAAWLVTQSMPRP